MTRQILVSDETRKAQKRAADPKSSIWVSANAGSGKTYVLTQRVLRLLLSGVEPAAILCLTYTKAAAAEMRRRVGESLAKWALLEDAALARVLTDLDDGAPLTREGLERARTLFARALETPGGLKILTIHAFCESLLHRFPLEAQVPFDFAVIEEDEQADLIRQAREAVLAGGLKGIPALAGPVEILFKNLSDSAIEKAIDSALADGRKLRAVLADPARAKRNLRSMAGTGQMSAQALEKQAVRGMLCSAEHIRRALEICPPKGSSAFEDDLATLDLTAVSCEGLFSVFLTKKYEVPSKFPKKAFRDADPELAAVLLAEAQRLCALAEQLRAARLVERSEALLDVLAAIWQRFEGEKRRRSLLDFDDLVARVARLLADRGQGDWVRYKLDAAITHILVDESQDTNPEQWAVVRALADEFFVGEGSRDALRTIFAVGDEKQSIYSFQGADPHLFKITGNQLLERAKGAKKEFGSVQLNESFRTLLPILRAVDAVGAGEGIAEALLLEDRLLHRSARSERFGGSVTLWPPLGDPEGADAPEWPLEASEGLKSAHRKVAERIAGEIARWVRDGRQLGPRGRPVSPDDVLVLVQARNRLFFEIISALHRNGLPTPGADRLAVTSHIAVLDLLALGDVLLNPADDLQLAALLRSPLFDVSEDDLFALCHRRGGGLWEALDRSDLASAGDASDRLRRWRRGLDFERPFEFFAQVLYPEGGLKRFHRRIGGEVDDVLSQFLSLAIEHEQSGQPSLQGFLAALRSREVWVRRELAESGNGVRVMTVHGAKGLEAPVVILADATAKPEGVQISKPVYLCVDGRGPVLVHASRKDDHVPKTLELREEEEKRQRAEYWRKLYVAMTRAEDELYVTGVLNKSGSLEGCWYEAIEAVVRDDCSVVHDKDGLERAIIHPRQQRSEPAPMPDRPSAERPRVELDLQPLPPPRMRNVLRPSAAGGRGPAFALDPARQRVRDAEAARREGVALHALLQHLSGMPAAQRAIVGKRALDVLLPEAVAEHHLLLQKTLRILDRPEFTALFGPNSRAEVPIVAELLEDGRPRQLSGRIDRLVVDSGRVLVVDYKSDAEAPSATERIPGHYLRQLGLYALVARQLFPKLAVDAAILWTTPESLMKIPEAELSAAVAGFTIR